MASAPRYAIAALSYARAASSSTSKMPRYLYFLLAYCPSLASQRPLLRFFVTPRYLELPRVKQQLWRRMYDTSSRWLRSRSSAASSAYSAMGKFRPPAPAAPAPAIRFVEMHARSQARAAFSSESKLPR